MSPRPIRISRRSLIVISVMVMTLALVAGFLAGVPVGDVSPVFASGNHPANSACPGPPDPGVTSAVTVTHHTAPSYLGTSTVVEPATGEDWQIDAVYYPAGGAPAQTVWTAYADVDWNGSAWAVSNVTLPYGGPFIAITVCQGATCDAGGGSVHSWEYKLIVDVAPLIVDVNPSLDHVTYTTLDIDDGDTIEDPTETQGNCYEGTSVSPTSQTFVARDYQYDWGAGLRCPYNCNTPGTTVTLYYD